MQVDMSVPLKKRLWQSVARTAEDEIRPPCSMRSTAKDRKLARDGKLVGSGDPATSRRYAARHWRWRHLFPGSGATTRRTGAHDAELWLCVVRR